MIIIDASGATSGMDFEAFIRGGFLTEDDSALGPSWDNTPGAFTGEELFFSFGAEAASKYVLAHGEGITYDGFPPHLATHTVYGLAEVLEFGTRGSGEFNADGYFTGGNVELRISGLDFSNLIGEAGGPVNNFALAYMMGTEGAFVIYADALDSDAQTFLGSDFDDVFSATAFADILKGGLGADDLDGGDGADEIKGGDGNDDLDGGTGVDLLKGGRGKDLLTGGDDADTFVFGALKHSPVKGGDGRDTILDFDATEGDVIDLSGLRKKVDFIGSDGFSGDREVRYVAKQDKTIVAVDINGDTKTDLKFKVVGSVEFTEGDFIL